MADPQVPHTVGDGSFSIGSRTWPGLSKFIEEVGEALQVVGKLIATHGAVDHWEGSRLDEKLIEELSDVRAAVELVEILNLTVGQRQGVAKRHAVKLRQFLDWHDAQGHPGAPVPPPS